MWELGEGRVRCITLRIMAVAEGRLVGRDVELEVVDRALGRLRQGYGSALAVLADAGIGKTRVLEEVSRRAHRGEVVVRASASEFEGSVPYGALVAAFDHLFSGQSALTASQLAALDASHTRALHQVLLSYPDSRLTPVTDPAPAHEVLRAFRALLETVTNHASHLFLLDDLQWADSATIAAVTALLRRPVRGRLLMVIATRTRQTPAGLMTGIDDAVHSGYADRLDLRALTLGETRELVGPERDENEVATLYEASAGNPFYLQQLQRASTLDRRARQANGAPTLGESLPPAVTAALTAELESLAFPTRRYLEGASVAGDPFDPELAALAADIEPEAAVTALDELLSGDLVRHDQVPRTFRFRHPLLRRAVYQAAPGGWRMTAHARCAQEMGRRGTPPSVIAPHVEQSARHGDTHAVELLSEAGRQLVHGGSPADGARFHAAALRLASAPADSAQGVALRLSAASAYAAGGRFEAARELCLDALATVGQNHEDAAVALTSVCAGAEHWLGLHDQAHARLTEAVARMSPDTTNLISLYIQLCFDSLYRLDPSTMTLWGRRAAEVAQAQGDVVAHLHALALTALGGSLGALPDAADALAAASALADTITDEHLAEHPGHLAALAGAAYHLDDYAAAGRHIDRALRVARAGGRAELLQTMYWAGIIHHARGDLTSALDAMDTATEIAGADGTDNGQATFLATRALLCATLGDQNGALMAAGESVHRTRDETFSLGSVMSRLAYALALLESGQPGPALDQLDACGSPQRLPRRWQTETLAISSACHLAADHPELANREAARARQVAAVVAFPTAHAVAQRATATIECAIGDPHAASECAKDALATYEQVGAVLEAERTRLLHGRILAAAGEHEAAVEQLQVSASRFDQLGAHGLRSAAEQELRKLGARRHRRSTPARNDGSALASLTGREHQVAHLVAQGRTNPQVAAELFVSTKTVESHLRNAFHKLHVSSRLELARLIDREEPGAMSAG
jgi:DNA-binding CsgD family transcriptional regulator